jgi:hypothetical protein
MLEAGRLAPLVDLLGGLGLLFVLAATVRGVQFLGWALFVLAGEFVAVDASGRVSPATVVAYAAGLLVVCELLVWSAELPTAALADQAFVARRLLVVTTLALAAAVLALLALAATSLRVPGAFEAALIGGAAAAALLALPEALARRFRRP